MTTYFTRRSGVCKKMAHVLFVVLDSVMVKLSTSLNYKLRPCGVCQTSKLRSRILMDNIIKDVVIKAKVLILSPWCSVFSCHKVDESSKAPASTAPHLCSSILLPHISPTEKCPRAQKRYWSWVLGKGVVTCTCCEYKRKNSKNGISTSSNRPMMWQS